MRYRKLGSSDLEVSEIALGAWLTYAGGIEFDQTRACTDAAFDPHDPLPGFFEAFALLWGAARHPRGFLRSILLDR